MVKLKVNGKEYKKEINPTVAEWREYQIFSNKIKNKNLLNDPEVFETITDYVKRYLNIPKDEDINKINFKEFITIYKTIQSDILEKYFEASKRNIRTGQCFYPEEVF